MKTCSLHPSEELHALKRKNVYLFSAMHLPDFQVAGSCCTNLREESLPSRALGCSCSLPLDSLGIFTGDCLQDTEDCQNGEQSQIP
ncbi:hypothetical protein GRJ2_000299900 [Grus japonensis]|uniref:Uncharacterized protein n=1 Tax=Grus japonensis TaxID=30415 RepID=A0ABC9VY97_GRUJA